MPRYGSYFLSRKATVGALCVCVYTYKYMHTPPYFSVKGIIERWNIPFDFKWRS